MAKTVTIIDTFGFFFRSFYALPQHLKNQDGFPTGLLTGFTNFIATLQKQHDSDYIVFAIDSKGPTFRNEIDCHYKANRSAPPEELTMQLPIAIEWIDKMGYKTLGRVGFEADDIIATVTKFAKEKDYNVRVVSHDKDLYQLIDDGKIVIVDAIKRKSVDEEACFTKYGVTPKQFIDYQSILGDSADNVPGVKGIGKVGAEKLLVEFGTLDNIYANIEQVKPAGIQKKLIESKANAYMSKELVTLKDNVLEAFDFEEYRMDVEHPFLNIYDELVKYEQNAILRVLHAKNMVSEETKQNSAEKVEESFQQTRKIEFQATLITDAKLLTAILDRLDANTLIAFDTETTGLDYEKESLVGFSFCLNEEEAYYVPIAHFYLGVSEQISKEDAKGAIRKIFNSRVIGHNIKFDLHFVSKFLEDDRLEVYADSMILAWLINPESALSLDKLADKLLNHTMVSFKDTVKKGDTFASVELEDACKYAAEDAFITLKLFHLLNEKLRLQDASHLIEESWHVEVPFITTLLSMEKAGIKVDSSFLDSFLVEVKESISDLTRTIYEKAGSEFNINSTQQLGVVLFEHLGLPVGKKTKTGYSTDEKVLSGLKDQHEIIPMLLEYREVYKLFSTYIEPLLKLSKENEDSRIHTSFVQTGTATGRLSSKNPNLQNIPARSKLGLKIREAFVADTGNKLIGIDYSQIELRLLAHFSEDRVLVDAFKNDKDIHMQTAIALFGEEEAPQKRNVAKTVNFGLLYGMGQKKLSDTLGITTKEAKEIIEKYFLSFPTVKRYFRSIVDISKEKGYVETLLKRRRYFDYENATPMFKAAYERESVNSVFQGSASDLIKLSMNKIHNVIKEERLEAKMLLQIHDELIFEVKAEEAELLGNRFREIMENIMELNIPLKASVNIGNNWGELK
ncbi:MAG: DNA polymerase I [Epsilonproteobacteria bacterium]|nr:DNA polymerase I [Campylobacterota bacterium]OIO14261.1 MAG: DNA polymerase I [Helicobacteraceae bacterium CG1_02_36_14]PIP11187.1 MAG: DNA polymerase I [Sulfurimonas sp. CG23_combo_of_CG06-09_8_20_14_all_36_33]PIS25979.1 MAG: DNA polymerase I [Sulfurimonas sp. CG08_land_8_20_14_0_20_36_33]PIU35620.1 MAG: DNA polymerase I [Sulfurimonas sp. CG07_land_8_20_14_0_80_36_56]PIV04488.1 MAG: DNA polymerase I [Sulfurimonas sp. CG03_land_8_20_14_0_80_36_25]PIV35867.1 MAG: DNA polymerase I [Sulfurimo